MDDMAYLMMLDKLSEIILRNTDENTRNIFKYSVLTKKGYDIILGYNNVAITLYGRTNFFVENCLFIEQEGKKYFDLSFNQKHLPDDEKAFTADFKINCSDGHSVTSGTTKSHPLVMNMVHPPRFNAKVQHKVIPFEYDGFLYFFNCNVNLSLVEYYRDLPPINISNVYLNYGLSESAEKSLGKELKNAVAGMSKTDAVNFLLKFTQSAFEYKRDELVYGQEKFSFPEETLCNSFADCEDKAMLFAYLVNETLGLKSVGLYYKDAQHINIAIESWKDDLKVSFTFNEHNYIICEPSGNGFIAGESATASGRARLIDW